MHNWEALYQVLAKRFQKKPIWSTDAMKLAEMIQLNEQYPSVVVRKTESAVNKINKKTEFNISLDVNRPRNGKAILTFKNG
ncbi:MAG: hypothetical protein MUP22_02700 [Desulfobacterales bacterium]|nr:hypothetical protein [Desulfobacterales bacterium]